MSLKVTLAVERERRKAAEAEVAHLRLQLERAALSAGQVPGITQHFIQAGEQLRQTKQWVEDEQDLSWQIIDFSPNLVHVRDEAGNCVLANKRYKQVLAQQLEPKKQPEATLTPVPQFRATTQADAAVTFEESYQLKNGETLVYRTTQCPLVRSDGTPYLLTFSSDITDLKQAHRLASNLAQAKQLFMANMSHEIRTPLHGIMGLAELLKKGELSDEQADYLEMILHNTENLLAVVNDTLDFAKVESGQISLESIPFDLVNVVQQAAQSFAFKTAEKGLNLHIVAPDAPLPLVQGDPYRLNQILVNLISNAIKFTARGSITITIAAIHGEQQSAGTLPVTISIEDTGIGISATSIEQIFNQFEQANSSISRLYGGTGLGLTICKNLVELQGGKIEVRSTPEQGSCFHFVIPYVISQEPAAPGYAAPDEPPADLLEGLTVLLVEDNAVNQLIAVSMLGQWQVVVDIAHNGEEALLKAFQRRYDLILMDIQMPQLDGLTATSRLRQTANPNQHTPIIAMTADAVRVYAGDYQAHGFTDFLVKPYHESTFYELLTRVSQRLPKLALAGDELRQPNTSELHYDFLKLGRLATDAEFITKMLQAFIARVPAQVQLLKEAAADANWPAVSREAHTLKVTFGSLNIHPATEQLKRLEALAEARASFVEISLLITAISQASERFALLFMQRLAELP